MQAARHDDYYARIFLVLFLEVTAEVWVEVTFLRLVSFFNGISERVKDIRASGTT